MRFCLCRRLNGPLLSRCDCCRSSSNKRPNLNSSDRCTGVEGGGGGGELSHRTIACGGVARHVLSFSTSPRGCREPLHSTARRVPPALCTPCAPAPTHAADSKLGAQQCARTARHPRGGWAQQEVGGLSGRAGGRASGRGLLRSSRRRRHRPPQKRRSRSVHCLTERIMHTPHAALIPHILLCVSQE